MGAVTVVAVAVAVVAVSAFNASAVAMGTKCVDDVVWVRWQ